MKADFEIDKLGLTGKLESKLYRKRLVSPTTLELEIRTKIKVKGILKFILQLIQERE